MHYILEYLILVLQIYMFSVKYTRWKLFELSHRQLKQQLLDILNMFLMFWCYDSGFDEVKRVY